MLGLAACGFGEGETSAGEASLVVTRDYGAEELLEASVEDPSAGDTVMRALDREADIETRYGGGFVQSIEGIEGGVEGGRSVDWFFYVDGVESPVGAAEVDLEPSTRIWWDHHDWTDVMRVPAVVGSWPAPFAAGEPARAPCAAAAEPSCAETVERIETAGGAVAEGVGGDGPLVLAGPWDEIRDEHRAAALEGPPSASGVFARFERAGERWELVAYDEELAEAERLGAGTGLVAAIEGDREAPTWLVTGTDAAGAEAAAAALGEAELANRFAVALPGDGEPLRLPVP